MPTVSGAVVTGTFVGEYWDTISTKSTSLALGVIESRAPDATFVSTAIDYPQGSEETLSSRDSIANFLGSDGASLVSTDPNVGDRALEGSVFRISGILDLDPGSYLFSVASDDGFGLTIGEEFIGFSWERSFAASYKVTNVDAALPFELIYFEDRGVAGLSFSVEALQSRSVGGSTVPTAIVLTRSSTGGGSGTGTTGTGTTGTSGTGGSTSGGASVSAVPLPPAFPMTLAALAALVLVRQRR